MRTGDAILVPTWCSVVLQERLVSWRGWRQSPDPLVHHAVILHCTGDATASGGGECGAQVKMHWVHRQYWLVGPEGNDIQKTNVPNLRMRFRADTFVEELSTVMAGAAAHAQRQGARSS